jgi:hypothetical protein
MALPNVFIREKREAAKEWDKISFLVSGCFKRGN